LRFSIKISTCITVTKSKYFRSKLEKYLSRITKKKKEIYKNSIKLKQSSKGGEIFVRVVNNGIFSKMLGIEGSKTS